MARRNRAALIVLTLALAMIAGTAWAHHSYAAYHNDQMLTIDGTLESFDMMNPHSLLKIRQNDVVSVFEWRAPNGLIRAGVRQGFFKPGERLVVSGNPHREYEQNRVVNLKTLCRPSDQGAFPEGSGCK
jgi:hypothetical protein